MAYTGPPSAIFSPSVARIAASTAKDWKYVDEWLATKFSTRSQPVFERNADTLQALLALVSVNEAADEEKKIVARAEALAQLEIQSHHKDTSTGTHSAPTRVKEELLALIGDWLPQDATSSLCALATLAVELGVEYPTPESLGNVLSDLREEEVEMGMVRERIQPTRAYIDAETVQADALLEALRTWTFAPSHDLARQNIELQRSMRALSARLADPGDVPTTSGSNRRSRYPKINDVAAEELEYLHLLTQKREMDARSAEFSGISADPTTARSELDRLHSRVETTTRQRDAVFEGLVERETPHKRR